MKRNDDKRDNGRHWGDWIDRFPPPEDIEKEDPEAGQNARRRKRLLDMTPQEVLDLHGFTSDKAVAEINRFIERSFNRGLQKILIIHGKGNHSSDGGVLSRITADCVSKHPLAGENGLSAGKNGGRGSRWIILRQRSR